MASSVPDEYLCPITRDIMSNPVILIQDGCTYEESALQSWLKNHNTSPLTNKELTDRNYTVNRALKSLISDYVSRQQTSSVGLHSEIPSFKIHRGNIPSDWKNRPTIRIKLTLLGSSNVGKTVLSHSLQYGQWPKSLTLPTTTLGNDLSFYYLDQLFRNEYVVSIQINDPPGQERFKAMTNHFFKQCHGALFVVDSTELESLNDIKKWWYPKLDTLGMDNVERILVCTKIDFFEQKEKEYRDLFLQNAEQFASTHYIPIIHVSAYRGENVEHVFKQLIMQILTNESLVKDLIREANIPKYSRINLSSSLNSTPTQVNDRNKLEAQKKNKKSDCCS